MVGKCEFIKIFCELVHRIERLQQNFPPFSFRENYRECEPLQNVPASGGLKFKEYSNFTEGTRALSSS